MIKPKANLTIKKRAVKKLKKEKKIAEINYSLKQKKIVKIKRIILK